MEEIKMAYFEGEVPVVTSGNYNNNGWNDWSWIIGLAVVGGIFGNGWGFGNNGNRGGNCATQADLSAGFANSEIMSDLNDIILGQASMQNFINQGFNGINTQLLSGFHGVDNAVCTLGYNMASGFNTIGHQISDCCCSTKAAIADLKYANEAQTCQLLTNQNAQTQRIIDYLTNEKIESLRAENVALKGRISNDAQSAYLLDKLTPCPRPAYVVPNPNCCPSSYNFGGCGC